jgi:hypothetical protein
MAVRPMDSSFEFTRSSDDDLLRLWANKSELTPEAARTLQSELENRRLVKVVYTIAGLPRVELLKLPPVSYEKKAPREWAAPRAVTRLLFLASGVFLAIVLRLLIPTVKSLNDIESLIAPFTGVVLIPLIVFLVLKRVKKVWKAYAPLATSVVAFAMTAGLFWYLAGGYHGTRQLRQGIERSSAGLIDLHRTIEQDLSHCRVPDILELLVSPDKLKQENLADAESRITRVKALLEDYGKQLDEWQEWVQQKLQPSAKETQSQDWSALKETLAAASQWLAAYKEYSNHISEFVRYMRYYQHLYKVVNHRIVFTEADGRQTYEYYKNEIQEYTERQRKMDAAFSLQLQKLIKKD